MARILLADTCVFENDAHKKAVREIIMNTSVLDVAFNNFLTVDFIKYFIPEQKWAAKLFKAKVLSYKTDKEVLFKVRRRRDEEDIASMIVGVSFDTFLAHYRRTRGDIIADFDRMVGDSAARLGAIETLALRYKMAILLDMPTLTMNYSIDFKNMIDEIVRDMGYSMRKSYNGPDNIMCNSEMIACGDALLNKACEAAIGN